VESGIEELVTLIERRAVNLFESHQLYCSESVLLTLNRAFCGDLSDELAIRLTSAMTEGFGGSGCVCGALSGGVLALGLFLGRHHAGGRDRNKALVAAKELHDHFKETFGPPCCRVQNMKAGNEKKAHFRNCARLTGAVAGKTAELILKGRRELLDHVDRQYLEIEDSVVKSTLKRVVGLIR